MKAGCMVAYCYYVEAMPNKEHAFRVVYDVEHNHTFGSLTNLGSRQLSKVVKSTIRSLLTQGSTINNVMLQLTMDYDKFTAVLGGATASSYPGTSLSPTTMSTIFGTRSP
jgi:hypothetical protein